MTAATPATAAADVARLLDECSAASASCRGQTALVPAGAGAPITAAYYSG